MKKIKFAVVLTLTLCAFGITLNTYAEASKAKENTSKQGFTPARKGDVMITALSETSVTTSDDKTYTITKSTTVTLNGKPAKFSDIAVGSSVKIVADSKGDTAVDIRAHK